MSTIIAFKNDTFLIYSKDDYNLALADLRLRCDTLFENPVPEVWPALMTSVATRDLSKHKYITATTRAISIDESIAYRLENHERPLVLSSTVVKFIDNTYAAYNASDYRRIIDTIKQECSVVSARYKVSALVYPILLRYKIVTANNKKVAVVEPENTSDQAIQTKLRADTPVGSEINPSTLVSFKNNTYLAYDEADASLATEDVQKRCDFITRVEWSPLAYPLLISFTTSYKDGKTLGLLWAQELNEVAMNAYLKNNKIRTTTGNAQKSGVITNIAASPTTQEAPQMNTLIMFQSDMYIAFNESDYARAFKDIRLGFDEYNVCDQRAQEPWPALLHCIESMNQKEITVTVQSLTEEQVQAHLEIFKVRTKPRTPGAKRPEVTSVLKAPGHYVSLGCGMFVAKTKADFDHFLATYPIREEGIICFNMPVYHPVLITISSYLTQGETIKVANCIAIQEDAANLLISNAPAQ